MAGRNARLGLVLFAFYAACYAAFVLPNAFAAGLMEWTPIAGLNLAILSGFGLIVLAMVLALIYGVTAKSAASTTADPTIISPTTADDESAEASR